MPGSLFLKRGLRFPLGRRIVVFVGAIMLAALPAAAELHTIQSALTKPFPSIGDAVVGCRNPANTANWIDIITGKLWEREVQGRTLHPSFQDVVFGVQEFFHAYITRRECFGFEDGDQVTIEAQGHWYGVDMMCASEPGGDCYWIPAVDLQLVASEHLATREPGLNASHHAPDRPRIIGAR
jgi:hypothetical protein